MYLYFTCVDALVLLFTNLLKLILISVYELWCDTLTRLLGAIWRPTSSPVVPSEVLIGFVLRDA